MKQCIILTHCPLHRLCVCVCVSVKTPLESKTRRSVQICLMQPSNSGHCRNVAELSICLFPTFYKTNVTVVVQFNSHGQVNEVMTLFQLWSTLNTSVRGDESLFSLNFQTYISSDPLIIFLLLSDFDTVFILDRPHVQSVTSSSSSHTARCARHHHQPPAVATCARGIRNVTAPRLLPTLMTGFHRAL